MATTNLAPTLEPGQWKCLYCNQTLEGREVVDDSDNGTESLITTAFINQQKKCPDCGQPMFFEPYLKGGPPRDTIFSKKLEA